MGANLLSVRLAIAILLAVGTGSVWSCTDPKLTVASEESLIGTGATALPAPTNLAAIARDPTTIELSWSNVSGATTYNLYFSQSSGVTSKSTQIRNVSSPFKHQDLLTGSQYFYRVGAVRLGQFGRLSDEVVAFTQSADGGTTGGGTTGGTTGSTTGGTSSIPAPILTSPLERGASYLSMSWSTVPNATDYRVFYNSAGSVSLSSSYLTASGTSVTHSSISGGLTYKYRVAAIVGGVVGALSNEVSGVPLIGQLPMPVISPGSGFYASTSLSVSITTSVSGAAIYYTADGSTPSCSGANASLYSGQFEINSSQTITAIACHTNYSPSQTVATSFAINPPTCGNFNNGCYDNAAAKAVKFARISATSTIIEYVKADSACVESDCFMIWKERGGDRILNATGVWVSGISEWQKKLNRDGVGPIGADQYFTQREILSGRVCPVHVFVSRTDMTSTNQCLYYDSGNQAQGLDRDGIIANSVNGQDFLIDWTATVSGRGSLSSWYEGNIKVCADKGMRLPTLYETSADRPSGTPSDAIVKFAGSSRGVPSLGSNSWTATPNTVSGTNRYFSWSNNTASGVVFTTNSNVVRCVMPSDPVPFCGNIGNGCYDNSTVTSAGSAYLAGDVQIEYVPTGNGNSIWREKGGQRILKATGLWSTNSDWQQSLARSGLDFTVNNFVDISQIGGRSCPNNVFLNHGAMTETNLCVYYDAGNSPQWLNRDKTGGVIGQDYLEDFTGANSGGGTSASWYEGNIKTCADKGMRLPTLYETQVSDPISYKPTDASPVFSSSSGVPNYIRSWTASASPGTNALSTWFWQGASTSAQGSHYFNYNAWSYQGYVRCVLPPSQIALNITAQPTNVISLDGTASFAIAVTSSAGTTLTYQWQRSTDNGVTFTNIPGAVSQSLNLNNLKETDHLSQYRMLVSATSLTLSSSSKTSSVALLRVASAMPLCGDVAGKGCYDNAAANAAGEALLQDNTMIQYVKANPACSGTNCFMVWKDTASSRILRANGMWSSADDWQKKLVRSGTSYSTSLLTDFSSIAGRACPTNVFVSTSNKTSTGQCVYYDAGNADQTLSASAGIEAEDNLSLWNRSATGNGSNASWYEGNIKVCADKGMRLPTLYETTAAAPTADRPTDSNPVFGGTRVPNFTGTTWTASALTSSSSRFFTWTSSVSLSMSTTNYIGPIYVRCVLP